MTLRTIKIAQGAFTYPYIFSKMQIELRMWMCLCCCVCYVWFEPHLMFLWQSSECYVHVTYGMMLLLCIAKCFCIMSWTSLSSSQSLSSCAKSSCWLICLSLWRSICQSHQVSISWPSSSNHHLPWHPIPLCCSTPECFPYKLQLADMDSEGEKINERHREKLCSPL